MDRIQMLNKRIDELEEKINQANNRPNYYNHDKPKLAAAITGLAFMALFIASFALGWHWGWSIAIGVVGLTVIAGIVEE